MTGPVGRPAELEPRRLLRHLGRGMRRRCPLCADRRICAGWLRMRPVCLRCGLRTDRGESDYFIGGYTVNFLVAEATAAALIAIVLFLAWPDVPWRGLMWGGAALMVALPVLFFPFSRTLWLAIDLTFRPPREEDFTARPTPGSTPADARG